MDSSQVYALVLIGIACLLLLVNGRSRIILLTKYLLPIFSKHIYYRNLLGRHKFLGPWTYAQFALCVTFIAGNLSCLRLWNVTIPEAGARAGTLATINLGLLLAFPQFNSAADLLGIKACVIKSVHRLTAIMAVVLAMIHTLTMLATRPAFPLDLRKNLFAVIAISSIGIIMLGSLFVFRRISYEIFLRSHQALATLAAYSLWRHLPGDRLFPRMYLYISVAVFGCILITDMCLMIDRNGIFFYRRARADITPANGAVNVRIYLQKSLKIGVGQSIYIWMPSVSFWSFVQSHPFVVISWSEEAQEQIDLLVEPWKGFTRELAYHAESKHAINPWVLFAGPYGRSVNLKDSENVLMVASDFGIAAHLPYLKQLIHGYNARQVRTRRIHFVWQVRDINVIKAAEPLLNGALDEDTLDDGWILSISIYCETSDSSRSFGRRAQFYSGKANLKDIVQEEVSGQYIERRQVESLDWNTKIHTEEPLHQTSKEKKLMVTVSSARKMRDDVREAVRKHLTNGVQFYELDYQPS